MCKDPVFLAILLVLISGYPSTVTSSFSLLTTRRFLTPTAGISTAQGYSPAPSPASGLDSGGGKSGDIKPRPVDTKSSSVSDKCSKVESCRDGNKLSACLAHPGEGSKDTFLILKNSGEDSLTIKVVYAPENASSKEVILEKQQTKEYNVTAQIVGSSLVVLNAGSGECVVHISLPDPGHPFEWQFPYAATVNPVHGVYFLFGTAAIVGGIWACCRFRKSERRVDWIPYQELEMGQTEVVSANDGEATEGWDEDWDDNWDEIREVKPPGQKATGNGSANGMASKSAAAFSDRKGWENNWKD
ncbi:hypothetical protein MLD38_038199 [Melastoma candidum]|uniref:Uncharacterized protein n=1 Tax=Melastoma candidum TaxID=119954 RepID=A0ACB9KYE7_9MYRT|nr:hypothetical protein MLD38_038199 [Melastoma candidum]